jgi:hypothetical protein
MATTLSSYTRIQNPTSSTRSSVLVTPVPARRQPVSRSVGPAHSLFTLPKEPEDARLTGGTRSLDRRLLALNVAGTLGKRKPTSERGMPPARAAVA